MSQFSASYIIFATVGGWLILNSLFDVLAAVRSFVLGGILWASGRFSRDERMDAGLERRR